MTDSINNMDAMAQSEYIKCMKLGIQFSYKSPNKFYYMYRKNMLEPSLREKYCSTTPYCVWVETYDVNTRERINLQVYPISEAQASNWTSMLSKFN